MLGKPGRVLRVFFDVARHPLNKGRRFRSMVRWGRLLIASHLSPTGQITIPYVNGTRLHWPRRATSALIAARYGLGEYEDMSFCLHLLRQDDLFCDVGANVGVYTVLAGAAVGCDVISVEPIPSTFAVLMQNVFLNGLAGKVRAVCAGVGREHAELQFTAGQGSFNHVALDGDSGTIPVPVQRLDDILQDNTPTMLKIDVEGFEAEVVAGARNTLSNSALQALLIEMSESHVAQFGSTLDVVTEQIHAAGLKGPLHYDPVSRRLLDGSQVHETKRHINRRFNQIFVRDIDAAHQRLMSAAPYQVNGAKV